MSRSPKLFTRHELAERLKIGVRTVDYWVHHGIYNGVRLHVERAGRSVRIDWADYQAFQREVDRRRFGREMEVSHE